MSDPNEPFDPYLGWNGQQAHPRSPQGGGGPGFFSNPKIRGMDFHPMPPEAPIVLAQYVPPKSKTPDEQESKLPLIDQGLGGHSAAQLNDALKTVFGEISSNLHADLRKEARAVASTIFNRLALIAPARKAQAEAKQALDAAELARKAAQDRYEDLANHPTKYIKEHGGQEDYKKVLAAAKADYDAKTRSLGAAQAALRKANDKKTEAESYLTSTKRNHPKPTLSDIVEPDEQYKGTAKGRGDYHEFANMSKGDQARNAQRWREAKAAVEALAEHPEERLKFIEFRSAYDVKGKLKHSAPGRTRIGGNDFW